MNNKPFWQDKTCKEMAGLHVKVTFNSGTIVTGVTNMNGDITEADNLSGREGNEKFVPNSYIKSIELLDDPEYERIEDIYRIDTGDVVVCRSGNKYPVVNSTTHELRIKVENYGAVFISREDALFGLCPKPKLPDHDGLWLDKDGKTWVVFDGGEALFDPDSLEWWPNLDPAKTRVKGVAFGTKSDDAIGLAPFRPAKAVEA